MSAEILRFCALCRKSARLNRDDLSILCGRNAKALPEDIAHMTLRCEAAFHRDIDQRCFAVRQQIAGAINPPLQQVLMR
jgi:hypothetical protein